MSPGGVKAGGVDPGGVKAGGVKVHPERRGGVAGILGPRDPVICLL